MNSLPCIALSALAALGGCSARRASAAPHAAPSMVLHGVGFKLFRGSELRVLGRASEGAFERESADATASRLELDFLGADAGKALRLEMGQAAGDLRLQLAEASSGVRLSRADGTVATTERSHLIGPARLAEGID